MKTQRYLIPILLVSVCLLYGVALADQGDGLYAPYISSASVTPSPVDQGDDVFFQAEITDPDGADDILGAAAIYLDDTRFLFIRLFPSGGNTFEALKTVPNRAPDGDYQFFFLAVDNDFHLSNIIPVSLTIGSDVPGPDPEDVTFHGTILWKTDSGILFLLNLDDGTDPGEWSPPQDMASVKMELKSGPQLMREDRVVVGDLRSALMPLTGSGNEDFDPDYCLFTAVQVTNETLITMNGRELTYDDLDMGMEIEGAGYLSRDNIDGHGLIEAVTINVIGDTPDPEPEEIYGYVWDVNPYDLTFSVIYDPWDGGDGWRDPATDAPTMDVLVQVTDQTEIMLNNVIVGFEAIEIGMFSTVQGEYASTGAFVADLVFLDGEIPPPPPNEIRGMIDVVIPEMLQFSVLPVYPCPGDPDRDGNVEGKGNGRRGPGDRPEGASLLVQVSSYTMIYFEGVEVDFDAIQPELFTTVYGYWTAASDGAEVYFADEVFLFLDGPHPPPPQVEIYGFVNSIDPYNQTFLVETELRGGIPVPHKCGDRGNEGRRGPGNCEHAALIEVHVTPDTVIFFEDMEVSFDAIQVGMYTFSYGEMNWPQPGDYTAYPVLTAFYVELLDSPPPPPPMFLYGEITELYPDEQSFLLDNYWDEMYPLRNDGTDPNNDGIWQTYITVTDDTAIYLANGEFGEYGDLAVTDFVDVFVEPHGGSGFPEVTYFTALEIYVYGEAPPPVEYFYGPISEIDSNGSFAMTFAWSNPGSSDAWTYWFHVTSETLIYFYDGTPASFEDLAVGLTVYVTAVPAEIETGIPENFYYTALDVWIEGDVPPIEYFYGPISEIDSTGSFAMDFGWDEAGSRNTWTYWFAVTSDTMIYYYDGTPAAFEDLAVGMLVSVAAVPNEMEPGIPENFYYTALEVLIEGDEPQPPVTEYYGTVTVVDYSNYRFSFAEIVPHGDNHDGPAGHDGHDGSYSEWFYVTSATLIYLADGVYGSFDDIQVGEDVFVLAREMVETDCPRDYEAIEVYIQGGPVPPPEDLVTLHGYISDFDWGVMSFVMTLTNSGTPDGAVDYFRVVCSNDTVISEDGELITFFDLELRDEIDATGYVAYEPTSTMPIMAALDILVY